MGSPIKSLSFREDGEGSICLHLKVKRGLYKSIANFWFEIQTFVKFEGVLKNRCGYLFEVHKMMGGRRVSKKCFVPCQQLDSARQFKYILNQSLAEYGGVFWQDVKDGQIRALLQKMTDTFFLEDGKIRIGVTTVGRQYMVEQKEKNYNPENDIYVFNEFVQVNGRGETLLEEEKKYVWVDAHACSDEDKAMVIDNDEFKINIEPNILQPFSWRNFLDAALPVLNVNFYPSVMMLAGAIACFHYPYSIKMADACPAPMAIGAPGSGKSTTIELISKLLGCKVESQATGEVIQTLLQKTTIPLCWDDPTYPSNVKTVLSGSFDSKGKRTKGKGKEVPKTNVVLAVNFELDDDLRSFERIVPIVYNAPDAPDDPAQYRQAKDNLSRMATTSCIPWVIKLGAKLINNKSLVDNQVKIFRQKDPSLNPRFAKLYGLYKAIVKEIIDESNLDESSERPPISSEDYETYLEQTFLPYVCKIVQASSNAVEEQGERFEHFCKYLGKSLQDVPIPDEALKTCVRNNVIARTEGAKSSIHVILPELVQLVEERMKPTIVSFNQTKLRKAIRGREGTSVEHTAVFGGVQRKCVKIPRSIINNDVLQLIDRAFGLDVERHDPVSSDTDSDESQSDRDDHDTAVQLKNQLAAVEQRNEVLIAEKGELEKDLAVAKSHCTAAKKTVAHLQSELARKEREWKASESQLKATIKKLRDDRIVERETDERTTCIQTAAAGSFSQLISSGAASNLSKQQCTIQENLDDSGISLPLDEQEAGTPAKEVSPQADQTTSKKRTSEIARLTDKLHKGIIDGKRQRISKQY